MSTPTSSNVYQFNSEARQIVVSEEEQIEMLELQPVSDPEFELLEECFKVVSNQKPERKKLGFFGNLKWNFRRMIYNTLQDMHYN